MSGRHSTLYRDRYTTDRHFTHLGHQKISVCLRYTDRKNFMEEEAYGDLLATTTIREALAALLRARKLTHIRAEDVRLANINDRRSSSIPADYLDSRLYDLGIRDGDTLYFESSVDFHKTQRNSLTIHGPNNKSLNVAWDKNTTTLWELLKHVIEIFSLSSIERSRIHLFHLNDELNLISNSQKLLKDLYIEDDAIIIVQITPSTSSKTDLFSGIRIECTWINGHASIDALLTDTIDDLKEKIRKHLGNYLLVKIELYDKRNNLIDISDSTRMLCDHGIGYNDTISAKLQVAYRENLLNGSYITNDHSSFIADAKQNKVLIGFSGLESKSITMKISPKATVSNLIRKIETVITDPPVKKPKIWFEETSIHEKDFERTFEDLGIKSTDTIFVILSSSIFNSDLPSASSSDNRFRSSSSYSTPSGLSNLGNTCFMNSALQCLVHVKPLTEFFLDGLTRSNVDTEKLNDTDWNSFYDIGPLTGAYVNLLRNLRKESRNSFYYASSFRPNDIKEIIGSREPRFATYDQQDAQEFLSYFLREIHKEMKEKNKTDSNTIIKQLFYGKIQSTITCLACKHKETTTNQYNVLSLPIQQQERTFLITFVPVYGSSQEMATVTVPNDGQIKDLVRAFVKRSSKYMREILVMSTEGPVDYEVNLSELPITEVTFIEQDKYSYVSAYDLFERRSKTLTIEQCLDGFFSVETLEDLYTCEKEACQKRSQVTKQLRLESIPTILVIQLKRFSHENGFRQKIDTFVRYPIDGLNLTRFLSSPRPEEECIYDLFAVSNHIGSIYGGHYTAYARQDQSKWFQFDDSLVTNVYSEPEVVSGNAYILFYIKRNATK